MALSDKKLTFVDLFAGIGGFHFAFEGIGTCVYASEKDASARQTYRHNFRTKTPALFASEGSEQSLFNADITNVNLETRPKSIPDFDVLCGGFPCQPFSQAGKRQGFDDENSRGNLFENNILHILAHKTKTRAVFLENVRGLRSLMSGDKSTLDVILEKLLEVGFHARVYDVKATDFGLPQHRPRLFIVGFRSPEELEVFENHRPLPTQDLSFTMSDVFGGSVPRDVGFTLRLGGRGSGYRDRRNWDEYLVDGIPTRLKPEHAAMMQGFPKEFAFPPGVSEAARMRLLGNSVAVPAVRAYAEAIMKTLSTEVL